MVERGSQEEEERNGPGRAAGEWKVRKRSEVVQGPSCPMSRLGLLEQTRRRRRQDPSFFFQWGCVKVAAGRSQVAVLYITPWRRPRTGSTTAISSPSYKPHTCHVQGHKGGTYLRTHQNPDSRHHLTSHAAQSMGQITVPTSLPAA